MILANRYFRLVLAGCGLLLFGVGVTTAYWWLYKMGPLRRLADPEWRAAHSEAALWAEEQKDYERMGPSPDLFFRGDRIGYYGGKEWFLWLEERIRNPNVRHCGCTSYALALMANRHVASWEQWTDANRQRSQEEWIRDGFLECGVTVHLPPEPADTVPLLRLLGSKSWNFLLGGPKGKEDPPDAVPSYLHYNAYRWLRDSGFEPIEFASSNAQLAADPVVCRGLLKFSQWRAAYPGKGGLGVLALKEQSEESPHFDMRPPIAMPRYVAGVNAFIAISTIGGGLLFWRFIRRKAGVNLGEQPAAPSGGPAALPETQTAEPPEAHRTRGTTAD